MSNPPSNYASVDDTFRVSAKRFARSPWLSSCLTPETVLGVYSGRFFPLTIGEDPVEAYWNLRRSVALSFYDAEKRIPRGLGGAPP